MDAFESTDEEFLSDFGASAPSDVELLELLVQARATDNVPLRRLIKCYRVLRRVTAESISYLEARDGSELVDAVGIFCYAKFLSRNEPG